MSKYRQMLFVSLFYLLSLFTPGLFFSLFLALTKHFTLCVPHFSRSVCGSGQQEILIWTLYSIYVGILVPLSTSRDISPCSYFVLLNYFSLVFTVSIFALPSSGVALKITMSTNSIWTLLSSWDRRTELS